MWNRSPLKWKQLLIFFFVFVNFVFFFSFSEKYDLNLLGRGRRSTIVGVVTGVFLVGLTVAAAGAALPERACRFGEPSTFDGVGPTDCDRSAWKEKVRFSFDPREFVDLLCFIVFFCFCGLPFCGLPWRDFFGLPR